MVYNTFVPVSLSSPVYSYCHKNYIFIHYNLQHSLYLFLNARVCVCMCMVGHTFCAMAGYF